MQRMNSSLTTPIIASRTLAVATETAQNEGANSVDQNDGASMPSKLPWSFVDFLIVGLSCTALVFAVIGVVVSLLR